MNSLVDRVHTASQITREKLIAYGLHSEKIVIIPLGVDTSVFQPLPCDRKQALRKELCLPNDRIIIGSFQKDGNGWGKGLEPKLIKGPDIFCDVVNRLAKHHSLHILLTGPSRGYVIQRLKESCIPFTHLYFKEYLDVVKYYQILDIYLICSREEGGPKALLETMATGIPLVATRVGMVTDVLRDNVDGMMCDIENTDEVFHKATKLITQPSLREDITKNALERVKDYDIEVISQRFCVLYQQLM